jgi:hypothetical protein
MFKIFEKNTSSKTAPWATFSIMNPCFASGLQSCACRYSLGPSVTALRWWTVFATMDVTFGNVLASYWSGKSCWHFNSTLNKRCCPSQFKGVELDPTSSAWSSNPRYRLHIGYTRHPTWTILSIILLVLGQLLLSYTGSTLEVWGSMKPLSAVQVQRLTQTS